MKVRKSVKNGSSGFEAKAEVAVFRIYFEIFKVLFRLEQTSRSSRCYIKYN